MTPITKPTSLPTETSQPKKTIFPTILRFIFAALALGLLGGCASTANFSEYKVTPEPDPSFRKPPKQGSLTPSKDADENLETCTGIAGHVITIDRETKNKTRLNEYRDEFKCLVKRYLEYRKDNSEKNHILFFVNGGLNKTYMIRNAAAEQIPLMLDHGYFPVFLAWDSALPSSYGEQLAYVRNGILRESAQITAPFSLVGDLISPIFRSPVIIYNQSGRFIDSFFTPKTNKSLPIDYDPAPLEYDLNKDNLKIIKSNTSLKTDKIRGIRYLAFTPARLPLSILSEDIGRRAWKGMVRRAHNTVHHPGEYDANLWIQNYGKEATQYSSQNNKISREDLLAQRIDLLKKYPNGLGKFARLFTDISRCRHGSLENCNPQFEKTKTGHKHFFELDSNSIKKFWNHIREPSLKITMIGHSMGTIVLNELIPHFEGTLPINNIVYMAAAASIRETERALEPLLERPNCKDSDCPNEILEKSFKTPNFYSLMLHPKNEAREDSGYSLLPSGSLLEWLDEVLNEPQTALDRTMGKWRNLHRAKHVFSKKAQEKMTFVVFPRQPEANYFDRVPLEHGDFNETCVQYWDQEFWIGNYTFERDFKCLKASEAPETSSKI